nr:retrotransposon protein [Tanacetum cinerariifolium]
MTKTLYELLEDDQKKKLGKNNEAKMTLYNALHVKIKNCKIYLLTQKYEKFSISHEETIDSGFTRFNIIVTSLKSLDPVYSCKNHVRKFLRALPLKWRARMTTIEESKDLATLTLGELVKNLKDDWIVDSSFTKHMTRNRRFFTSYKAYNGGHAIFRSNLKGKVVGGGNITHDSITFTNVGHVSGLAFNLISVGQLCDDDCVVIFTKVDYTISKNGKALAKGHRRNSLYTYKLGDSSKQQIYLASVVDNSTLWHRLLGHANMRLV